MWRKEIDFKLRSSTLLFELEVPKTLVNIFIDFAVHQPEKNGWGLQAELVTFAENKQGMWSVKRATRVTLGAPVLSSPSTGVLGITKDQNLITNLIYRVSISKISAIVKAYMNTVVWILFSESISWAINILDVFQHTVWSFLSLTGKKKTQQTKLCCYYSVSNTFCLFLGTLVVKDFLSISVQFLRQKCQWKSTCIFKEALSICALAVLRNCLEVSWKWCNMLENNGITVAHLACPLLPTTQPTYEKQGRQRIQSQCSSIKSYLTSKDNSLPLLSFSRRHFVKYISTWQVSQETENTHHHLALWIQLTYSCICRGEWMTFPAFFPLERKQKTY